MATEQEVGDMTKCFFFPGTMVLYELVQFLLEFLPAFDIHRLHNSPLPFERSLHCEDKTASTTQGYPGRTAIQA